MTLQQQVHQLELIERRTDNIINDLEHGQLTELILPRETLSSVVDDSLPLEWYYRWCTIKPLWNEGWVFETRLPVVSEDPIIGYELIAFPVWGPASHTVKLDIARYAALDTHSGLVYEPRACQGTDPVVCSQGPNVRNGCAAAVVTQDAVTTVCHVLIVEEEQKCFSLAENEIVTVLEKSTLFAQLCPDSEQPKRVTISRGTHRIQWQPGCRLETHHFTINAALMPLGHRQVAGWYVPRGAIDLVKYFSNRTYPSALPPLIPLNMNLIERPPLIHWISDIDIPSIITWVVVLIVSSIISITLIRKYKLKYVKKLMLWCCSRSKPREATPEPDMLPNMLSIEEPDPVTQTAVVINTVQPCAPPQPYTFKDDC